MPWMPGCHRVFITFLGSGDPYKGDPYKPLFDTVTLGWGVDLSYSKILSDLRFLMRIRTGVLGILTNAHV